MTNARALVLAVDDTPANIDVVKAVLGSDYSVMAAINGDIALKIVSRQTPDLILLDIMMPDMDGYEVCRRLKADAKTRDIPVIFLTAKADSEDEAKGLALGAIDYITKPLSPAILKERVKNHLALQEARAQLAAQNRVLEEKVVDRTKKLQELQDVAMVAMGALAEARDPETGNHIRRTQHYVKLLAELIAPLPAYADELSPENISMLYKSAPLHDIGKVGIPDDILLKPAKLTDAEFEIMKLHPAYGRDAIEAAVNTMQSGNNFLRYAMEIAYSHHEKWDGSGYPQGLAGEDIPLSARLMAIADVYDALISRRVYKPAFSHEKSIAIMREGMGSHFDPVILDTFLANHNAFYQIAQTYADTQE